MGKSARDNLEDLDVNGRIKRTLGGYGLYWFWFRIGTAGGLL